MSSRLDQRNEQVCAPAAEANSFLRTARIFRWQLLLCCSVTGYVFARVDVIILDECHEEFFSLILVMVLLGNRNSQLESLWVATVRTIMHTHCTSSKILLFPQHRLCPASWKLSLPTSHSRTWSRYRYRWSEALKYFMPLTIRSKQDEQCAYC